jgi:hypothetical protein
LGEGVSLRFELLQLLAPMPQFGEIQLQLFLVDA